MSQQLLSAFGLADLPFTKEIPDAEFWLPPSKEAVVTDVVDALESRQPVLVAGEPGVGKTCVLLALRHRLPKQRFRLTYCHTAPLGRRDFYRQLCLALGLQVKATAAAVFHAVTTHVHELATSRVHPVFLLDEAHLLHPDVLGHLHILLNDDWGSRPCSLSSSAASPNSRPVRRRASTNRSCRACTRAYTSPQSLSTTPPSTCGTACAWPDASASCSLVTPSRFSTRPARAPIASSTASPSSACATLPASSASSSTASSPAA
ncbi:ATP-binding protein [Corallococcus macrosporus]|uniref:General secretion pathway protein GspA n=1 Tax=Corallococcus macrosporus DSM 14697 TaxID=1189310 RepID=A0A250JZ84_9BACT|nr:ATP-binding protein [Corallococcus macrosporus]ATB48416.1 general secretion pathway protein GspA [Corallococcus macrosporus DSM 14697]